jgi:hypothetical protein
LNADYWCDDQFEDDFADDGRDKDDDEGCDHSNSYEMIMMIKAMCRESFLRSNQYICVNH